MLTIIRKNKEYLFCLFLLFIPISAFAEIKISEIMYDLSGSDTDREWIEIYNSGNNDVDIEDYSLRENDTNHKLEISSGGTKIESGSYAVIVDSVTKFKSDNPTYSGIIIDSSFSLSNTGETLSLVKDDNAVDVISYTDKDGANGDGQTLNRVGNDLVANNPTPGKPSESKSGSETKTSDSKNTVTESSVATNQTSSVVIFEPEVYANAGMDKEVLAGASIVFEGQALGIKKEPLLNAIYRWNMGDGNVKNGKKISHVYLYPGKYVVSLNVISGEYSQGDIAVVSVYAPELAITKNESGLNGFVEISNLSSRDVNISGLILKDGLKSFTFPEGTILASKNAVKFLNSLTGIINPQNSFLEYGNGIKVSESITSKTAPAKQVSSDTKVSANSTQKIENTKTISQKLVPEVSADVGKIDSSLSEGQDENGGQNALAVYYFLGTLGLTFLVFGVFYADRISNKRSAIDDMADEYEIVEKIQ